MRPWFEEWFNSPYYHQLYFKRDEAEAKRFINKLIGCLQPAPQSRMLDIACGSGRHSRILAELGFEVTGIDLAADIIREAKRYETEKLHFFVHDMRLPAWINYFDYAFNFFTSFGYFDTRREHEDALRTIAQALKGGGIFVIDYLNARFAEEHLVPTSEILIDNVRYRITRWTDATHFFKHIIVEGGDLANPIEHTEKVTKFSLPEFSEMLGRQELLVEQVFGDYNFSSFDPAHSPRMILFARKQRPNG